MKTFWCWLCIQCLSRLPHFLRAIDTMKHRVSVDSKRWPLLFCPGARYSPTWNIHRIPGIQRTRDLFFRFYSWPNTARNKDIRLTSSFFYPVNWTLFHLSQSPPREFYSKHSTFCVQLYDSIIHVQHSSSMKRHLVADQWMKYLYTFAGSIVSILKKMKSVDNSFYLTTLAPSGGVGQHPIVPASSWAWWQRFN